MAHRPTIWSPFRQANNPELLLANYVERYFESWMLDQGVIGWGGGANSAIKSSAFAVVGGYHFRLVIILSFRP